MKYSGASRPTPALSNADFSRPRKSGTSSPDGKRSHSMRMVDLPIEVRDGTPTYAHSAAVRTSMSIACGDPFSSAQAASHATSPAYLPDESSTIKMPPQPRAMTPPARSRPTFSAMSTETFPWTGNPKIYAGAVLKNRRRYGDRAPHKQGDLGMNWQAIFADDLPHLPSLPHYCWS